MSLSDWKDLTTISKDIVTAIAAIIGVVFAYRGLAAWKKQLLGKAEYEAARKVLVAIYKVRDEITHVRNSYISPAELHEAATKAGIKEYDPTNSDHHYKAIEKVYNERFGVLQKARSDLRIELLEAEALWTANALPAVKQLDLKLRSLRVALIRYLQLNSGKRTTNADDLDKIEQIVYDLSESVEKPDEFMTAINQAVSDIETELRPHLSAKATGFWSTKT